MRAERRSCPDNRYAGGPAKKNQNPGLAVLPIRRKDGKV